jgi:hypothetical protein
MQDSTALEVVVLPIPGFVTVGAGVLLFGAFKGAVLSKSDENGEKYEKVLQNMYLCDIIIKLLKFVC